MTLKKLILLFVLAFLFQLTLVNLLSVRGIAPNLVLCLTVAITFAYEEGYRAIPFGLVAMLFIDITSAYYIGIGSLSLFITAIMVILFRRQLNVEQWAPLVVTSVLSTFVYNILYWALLKLLGNPMSIFYILKVQGWYALYNVVITGMLFWLMSRNIKKREVRRYDT